jgi:aminoglycoside phosphotransferase (APT) family kinase protein
MAEPGDLATVTRTNDQGTSMDAALSEEDKATAFVEKLTGGRVVKMKRLSRWRPAWFVDVEREGQPLLKLHLRGDRRSDVLPFPSLQREADILRVLESGGVPVPHVYGMCPDPLAIVMEAVPGVRAMSGPEDEQRIIAEEHMELLARMHQLDPALFAAIGLDLPRTASEIGLGMLDAYMPLYNRTKVAPEPLIEFAIAWARRNVPKNRTRASFVHWDAGQFLHENGKITALYDFETCLIGDPLMDLAALRLRHPAEPLGADLSSLFRHYEEVTGEPIDVPTLRFHTVVFALVGVMALAGPMVAPQDGSPHLEYLWWDLMQRRALVWALSECVGVPVDMPAAPSIGGPNEPSRVEPMIRMLNDALAQYPPATGMGRYQQQATSLLAQCLLQTDRVGPELDTATCAEYSAILGERVTSVGEAQASMESFVLAAGPESDTALIGCFARQVERLVFSLAPVADRVTGYALAAVKL